MSHDRIPWAVGGLRLRCPGSLGPEVGRQCGSSLGTPEVPRKHGTITAEMHAPLNILDKTFKSSVTGVDGHLYANTKAMRYRKPMIDAGGMYLGR